MTEDEYINTDELDEETEKSIQRVRKKKEIDKREAKALERIQLINATVEHLLTEFNFKTIFNKGGEDVWLYDKEEGIWKNKGNEFIQVRTQDLLGFSANNYSVREVIGKIKRSTSIDKEEFFNSKEGFICLNNGVLDLRKMELLPHSPEYYFRKKIRINYNPEAKCPECEKFFKEMLYPEDISVIQEWLGFQFFNKYFIKKAVICYGDTDTGKTVFLLILSELIGKENKSGLSLQIIGRGDKFKIVSLKDVYSNICDELEPKDLAETGGFKSATGNSSITGEHKFGDLDNFVPFAKLTFACNKIPKSPDGSDSAYYSRWIPIAFDNVIPKDEQDKFLVHKLTSKEEKEGLLIWSLEGLKRLLEKGNFSYNKSWEEIKSIMERNNSSLASFTQDVIVQAPKGKITKEVLYNIYVKYCNENKLQCFTKTQVSRNLQRFCPFAIPGNKEERYWSGIDVRESYKVDTIDTFLKNMKDYEKEENANMYTTYMLEKKASTPSTNFLVENVGTISSKPDVEDRFS